MGLGGNRCVVRWLQVVWLPLMVVILKDAKAEVLNPPYFNLAEGRKITASATCGEGVFEPELYCKLVGANTDRQDNPNINLIQGQVCDFCDPNDPKRAHPAENAIDGTEKWWQSPPLSRGNRYNEVNLTIDLGQEFHVAYVFIKMGNSPRPGVWILERSTDNGKTYSPWQYFADTPTDCVHYFGQDSLQPLTQDDSVICETKFSKVVPLEGGEIVVSLLNDRPNADNFSYSPVLQEWTKATTISLRFLRTKTLLGHLMSVARQDPTVTRRYFYSIKDINIGGRCVCNGHAETCDLTDPSDPYKLLCRCQHNTCGPQCEKCCPGFQQKKWRRAITDYPFVCEPCNCFGHSDECIYNEDVNEKRLSLDIHGYYEGGGVCQNCQHNTEGINCNQCRPTFYRPYGKLLNATDVCQPCDCDLSYSTGNCADGTGQCECRPEFLSPYCNDCSFGYYGYPNCRPCDCHPNGTDDNICEIGGGQCPCKLNYKGKNCNQCDEGFYGFPVCLPCDCNLLTSVNGSCNENNGQCFCKNNYGGRQCNQCQVGYYNYPDCDYCNCDPVGCVKEICNNSTGTCICRDGYGGPQCDRCLTGYFGYPNCQKCSCDPVGSFSDVCNKDGQCRCLANYAGVKCDQCAAGYYSFPECLPCECSADGSVGLSCDDNGECICHNNFDGEKCDICKEGFYNYPLCEECNCNPAGVLETFQGCGSLTSGELCECKERVKGRICNECKSLYWNLKSNNPLGCEDCSCYPDGTVGEIRTCDKQSGQCMCKPNVGSRQCSDCKDGSYELERDDLFGCKDCGCDIGGSVNNICDKKSGQCACRPRISGQRCNKPLQTHYFPTLFQYQFEIEDGRTPVGTQVRYGYEENVFPEFSWRGYAVFSDIQKEVLLDIYVEKPSLYQVLFYYLNFGGENIFGTVTFTPETFGDIQQSSDMVFEATSQPTFMRVSGKQGLIASPFVLNPGKWIVSIRVEKPLFLDYMVLLPQAYYEATLIQEIVTTPCGLNGNDHELCQNFHYPTLPSNAITVKGEAGYVADGDNRSHTNLFSDNDVLQELQKETMAWLDKEQNSLHLDFQVSKPGLYVAVITYHTPYGGRSTSAVVEVTTMNQMRKGSVLFYDCTYSFLCRQIVTDQEGEVAIFQLDLNFVSVMLTAPEDSSLAIDNIALVPAEFWHTDYIVPKPLCVRQNGECVESVYLPVPESTKIEFENFIKKNYSLTRMPENLIDENTGLIYLHDEESVIDLHGSVPSSGYYTFVVHYYQPDHPLFYAQVVIQNGQFYEAVLPLEFCPSVSGCRTVVQAQDTNATSFQILENYVITVKQPGHKSVWLDYILIIPASQFHESFMHPLPQDKAGKFITECGQNSFFLSPDIKGFCRDAVFSLTSEYNNGALPCQCDTDGSLSYECEQFGGKCQCKPNVIGRTCSQCKTGFFGFPNCRACDCPSTAYCHPVTGQCICPPRVTGERCDACVPYTYGFDPIIGCEECNCSPLGVSQGDIQCDLQTGQCRCKPNVVERACDKCKAGYWAYPYCQLCNCDLRGSTEDICEQETARCYCKENVYGDSCDQCKPGTFFLEETNPLGCTKCFCFGTTDRCSSAYLFAIQVYEMRSWKQMGLKLNNDLTEVEINATLTESSKFVRVVLPFELSSGVLFYFSAPAEYLGNRLSSYGGTLSYTLLILVDKNTSVGSFIGPDLILMGNNITIVHDHVEQPAGGLPFEVQVNLVEREFHHISGREVSREQMMMVLVNLDALLIRGSYFYPSIEIRLSNVLMDVAVEEYVADAPQALRVEQCQCPPSYTGNSCEKCAPGHYRAKTGPYLGYCVPCQCYGHAQTCDVNTGKCIDCKHHTIGDYCQKCASGYHGDATQGTPYDCLICACPLPTETNNFAESCELSPSGSEISCVCKPGYIGARCSACAAGFFGRPEYPGSSCQPCQCSGNIDPNHPGSCDSVTGHCVLCLNNTFGAACELCAPGFFGDAVNQKNCKKCSCNECGTDFCDHENGECICKPNVEGEACNHCAAKFWGFHSCSGCFPCNCGLASERQECDENSGQCICKPGAGGLTCDICKLGFWQYSEDGCISCNCNAKYSADAVCDAITGQCDCLPGVIGEKCDGCPYRWVFIDNEGCLECDTCIHALLDVTDVLNGMIDPLMFEMKDISTSYFANKRLQNVNGTVDNLRNDLDVVVFNPDSLDLSPLIYDVHFLEKQKEQFDQAGIKITLQAFNVAKKANSTRQDALEVENLINLATSVVSGIVVELGKLSEGLKGSAGQDIDYLLNEAESILNGIKDTNFDQPRNNSILELEGSKELFKNLEMFGQPVLKNKNALELLSERVLKSSVLGKELNNHSQESFNVVDEAQIFTLGSREFSIKDTVEEVNQLMENSDELINKAQDLLNECTQLSVISEDAYKKLIGDSDRLQLAVRDLKDHNDDSDEDLNEILPLTEQVKDHATFLMEQAALLDRQLADTRNSSDAAVKAANAYANIVSAIDNALIAADSAVSASEQAGSMSENVLEPAEESKPRSVMLKTEASDLQSSVLNLEPELSNAKKGVTIAAQQNEKASHRLDTIMKELDKLPLNSLGVLAGHAANGSTISDTIAKRARDKIQNIVERLPKDNIIAEQIPKTSDESTQAVKAAYSYIDRVSAIIPDTSYLMDRASKRESALKIIGTDVSEKIEELRRKIALARNQANLIKLGVSFFENTTLQLRNPKGMHRAATYTELSLYFKTIERYGLLAYIGNEKGSHTRMKHVQTDDYLALEIRGGRIVMTMDLGSGSQDIQHDAYVSDGKWHQVILKRIGKTCSLTVRTEDQSDSVIEGFLPGTFSVFNLDQQVSKIFIGGILDTSLIQDTIQNYRFDGCIEDVKFGETPLGLWDFVQAENNIEGCAERDQLAVLVPSNGLRFSGDKSYVILPRKRHNFASETYIKMKFKTYAAEGLLFFIGKTDTFLALELNDGQIVLKYDLGNGIVLLKSETVYNDGQWHSVEATRIEADAVLKVDNVEVDSGTSPGVNKILNTSKNIFVGGFSSTHSFKHVSDISFEGCIMDMQINTELIDLNKNKEALGVVSGCPATIARIVSFTNETTGYVAMPPADLEKLAQLTFKFKTTDEDGIIFYAANDDQSKYLLVALNKGILVMKSEPGGEIRTSPDVKYNDRDWHYVSATKEIRHLRLDIDDIDSVEIEVPVEALVSVTSPLYFGGLPNDYSINTEAVAIYKPFIGCLGDTTVNNKFQNFAETQNKQVASLASCSIPDPHQESTVTFPTYESKVPSVTSEAFDDKKQTFEVDVTLPEIITPEPTPVGLCALPLNPRTDSSVGSKDGIRFGNTPYSRIEFDKSDSFIQTIVDDSAFSLDFQTLLSDGVMFYVSGERHIDFIGLFLKEGKVVYAFNCGTGSAIISSQNKYDDGKWHNVSFSRQGQEGILLIDDDEEVRGSSYNTASSVNVKSPFYIGGLSEEATRLAKSNLKGIITSFPGCIRNVFAQGEELALQKSSLAKNVTICSNKVEEGTFFSSSGGYLILYDKYKVGIRREFRLDIKPRSLSGVLMAVHGNRDYLLLQMVEGRILFSVDNGYGPITTTYEPEDEHYLCNGKWHTISVAKIGNVVTLSVDGLSAEPGIGGSSVSSTDTDDHLYIGGLPDPSQTKGVLTLENYVGCIRNLFIDNSLQNLALSRIYGSVTLNTCSTI